MRMLPKGNQWGFKGLRSESSKAPIPGSPGSAAGSSLT